MSAISITVRLPSFSRVSRRSDGNHAATIKDTAGNTATYAWDTARDRLTSVTDPKGTVTSYTYDAMDRVTKVSTAIEGGQAAENTYTYTKDKLASIGHNGFQYGFTYDIYGNTSAVSIAGTNVVAYQYEPNNGNLLQTTYANGDVLRCTYDGQDRVTGIFQTQSGGTEQKLFTYTYDREGYLAVVKDETLARTTRLYYDLLGRLCQAEVSDGTGFRYTYDANNNMTSLKYYAEATFATDYTYDKDNRERTAKAFGHTRTTHYDKLGRVTEKNWDETTSGGTTTAVHKTLYRYFDTDAHKRWNQVRQISVGGKTTSYTYNAWGKLLSTTGSLASTIGVRNPFRYRGYYYDTETGLYYVGSRYYDPEIRRFISADDVSVLENDRQDLENSILYASFHNITTQLRRYYSIRFSIFPILSWNTRSALPSILVFPLLMMIRCFP